MDIMIDLCSTSDVGRLIGNHKAPQKTVWLLVAPEKVTAEMQRKSKQEHTFASTENEPVLGRHSERRNGRFVTSEDGARRRRLSGSVILPSNEPLLKAQVIED